MFDQRLSITIALVATTALALGAWRLLRTRGNRLEDLGVISMRDRQRLLDTEAEAERRWMQ